MKRLTALILCVLLIALCACGNQKSDLVQPGNFYYCSEEISYNSLGGVIQAEVREMKNFHNNAEAMLDAYLLGPHGSEYVTPVPAHTELISLKITDGDAYLMLSDEFAQISGMQLSTACACIAMTLSEYADVDTLHFSVETKQLDNKDEVILCVSDIVLLDAENAKG